ncbi:NADP-dependent oxidoreductase [Streptomyces sp. NPDC004539]|uniref:NADP-dependent oxidoreductase n=1 Tax=Streptomyces sp. NPDC004539 TaxID=3154280 RepID=UPI0033B64E38
MTPPGTTMRAAQFDRAGGLEVLRVRTLPIPTARPGRLVVKVRAAGVNPSDITSRRSRWPRLPRGTCSDFSGEITEAGPGAGDLHPGQPVWGWLGPFALTRSTGAAADYVEVEYDRVAPAPVTVPLRDAAALPLVGLTALHALRDVVRLRPGQRLLVVGAGGGVGTAAIQLAKAMGADVTAVAGSAKHALCRELGADRVIDHAAPAPAVRVRDHDALLACHGAGLRTHLDRLHRTARAAVLPARSFPYAIASSLLPGPRVRISAARPLRHDLEELAEHVDSGTLRPVIDQIHALESVQEAHRAVETGHTRGKHIIDLALT